MRLFLILFFTFYFSIAFSQDVNKVISEGTAYENALDENNALIKYLEASGMQPDNTFLLSKISELYSSIAGRLKNSESQKEYFKNATTYAVKALKSNPRSSDANFVMALVLGRTALKRSGRDKIDAVKNIKKYTDLSIQYNSENYKAWFLLGKWYYEIAGLNFFERTAVKMFYGELPSASTNDAIKAYKRSMELNSGFLFNYLSLARAYARAGDKQKAIELLNTMLKLPPKTADDSSIKMEGLTLLKKLS